MQITCTFFKMPIKRVNLLRKTTVIQNTAFTSQVQKMVNAWNEMVKKVRNIHEKLYNAKTIEINDVDFDYIENIYNNVDFCSDIYETINVFGL